MDGIGDTSSQHPRDLVVVSASAGGVEALRTMVVAELPPGFPAAMVVVLHLMSGGHSMLPEILSRSGPLPAKHAEDGEGLVPVQIFVARGPPPARPRRLDSALLRSSAASIKLDAINRRGRNFCCVVRALPLLTAGEEVSGALLLMGDTEYRHKLPSL
jgi:hypothetical protein